MQGRKRELSRNSHYIGKSSSSLCVLTTLRMLLLSLSISQALPNIQLCCLVQDSRPKRNIAET